jgi:hypothetical protein
VGTPDVVFLRVDWGGSVDAEDRSAGLSEEGRGSFSLQRVGVTYGASMYAAYARIYCILVDLGEGASSNEKGGRDAERLYPIRWLKRRPPMKMVHISPCVRSISSLSPSLWLSSSVATVRR